MNTRVSLAKPPNVFEQIVLAIRRRQFGFDPFQGGIKTVEPFAELSRCGRDRVAPAELKVRNRFIEVTTQSIARVWLEGALAILGDQFLDFAVAEVPARGLSARTSGFRGCAAFRSHLAFEFLAPPSLALGCAIGTRLPEWRPTHEMTLIS